MAGNNVQRIYPEAKTALIKWIEDNFHEIDEFMFVAELKDSTSMSIYDFYSYRGAIGTIEMAKENIHRLAVDGDFVPKVR